MRPVVGEHQPQAAPGVVVIGSHKRLKADELLNALGDWAASETPPDIGDGRRVIRIEPTTRSSLFAVYENGDEDHQILMKMNYEVIKNG